MTMPTTGEWILLIAGGALTLIAAGVFIAIVIMANRSSREEKRGKGDR